MTQKGTFDLGKILERVQGELDRAGVGVDLTGDLGGCCEEGKVKVVCVAPGLKHSVEELGRSTRDQVVMVRVDGATSEALDAWVETGALKSRSQAAALFIREGLKLRSDELDRLREALDEVAAARARLKEQAQEILGRDA